MKKIKSILNHMKLPALFSLGVFIVMVVSMLLVLIIATLLTQMGLLTSRDYHHLPLFLFWIVSVIYGTLMSLIISRKPLRPLNDIMQAADKIAAGDYNVRVSPAGHDTFRQLGEKFNHMAQELGSVEMLRSDFVNNFSHELKTPIVSMLGFAQVLKREDLSQQERHEYLDIIINEAQRLTSLTTNVLLLSKVENQSILTDLSQVNITEQVRKALALLQSQWSEKQLSIDVDSDEVIITANAELLNQVWINLLDNAIKFSPPGESISLSIWETAGQANLRIANRGKNISPDELKHVFDRFYQGDSSHTLRGNGLGLSLVREITQLHKGKASASARAQGGAVFLVTLPKEQLPSPALPSPKIAKAGR